jgi:putative ABC transport system ATP-binding protein
VSRIQVKNLSFTWPGSSRAVIDIPEWSIDSETIFLFGPSGSGKSTLIALLAGVLTPSFGEIRIDNQRLDMLSPSVRDRFRADNIGLVFQQFNLIPYLSVQQNILLPLYFSRKRAASVGSSNDQKIASLKLLEELELGIDCASKPANELSVGQQQRVAIARALIGSPGLIIADEPTSALDVDARDSFMSLLFREVHRINATLIFVSHDRSLARGFNRETSLESLNKVDSAEGHPMHFASVTGART